MTDIAEDPKARERWFLVAAVLINGAGEIGQTATVMPAASEPEARAAFLEDVLSRHGATGFAVKNITSAELAGLIVTRDPAFAPPAAAPEAEAA